MGEHYCRIARPERRLAFALNLLPFGHPSFAPEAESIVCPCCGLPLGARLPPSASAKDKNVAHARVRKHMSLGCRGALLDWVREDLTDSAAASLLEARPWTRASTDAALRRLAQALWLRSCSRRPWLVRSARSTQRGKLAAGCVPANLLRNRRGQAKCLVLEPRLRRSVFGSFDTSRARRRDTLPARTRASFLGVAGAS